MASYKIKNMNCSKCKDYMSISKCCKAELSITNFGTGAGFGVGGNPPSTGNTGLSLGSMSFINPNGHFWDVPIKET